MSQDHILMLVYFSLGVMVGIIAVGLLVIRAQKNEKHGVQAVRGEWDNILDFYELLCPVCGEKVGGKPAKGVIIYGKYCDKCGQAIAQKWEGEKKC